MFFYVMVLYSRLACTPDLVLYFANSNYFQTNQIYCKCFGGLSEGPSFSI